MVPRTSRHDPQFDSYSVDVPVCGRCWLALHTRRLAGSFVWWTVYAVGVILGFSGPLSRSVAIASVIVPVAVLLVAYMVDVKNPPRFDVRADHESATFTFRDLSLGYEFRALNPSARSPAA